MLDDRRHIPRVDTRARVEINLLQPSFRLEANSINLSEGGMCVRIQKSLEISSRVRMRLFPTEAARPLLCAGRVAWVVQRLDLRDIPPFLYDVGLEFVDPSRALRQFAAGAGVALKSSGRRPSRASALQAAVIRGRQYIPKLEKDPSSSTSWHLVVQVEGTPCFSHRYSSQRDAIQSWEQFKRRTTRPVISEVHR